MDLGEVGTCYVCRCEYLAEEMGRTLLPLAPRGQVRRRLRPICYGCFQSMARIVSQIAPTKVPLLHGY